MPDQASRVVSGLSLWLCGGVLCGSGKAGLQSTEPLGQSRLLSTGPGMVVTVLIPVSRRDGQRAWVRLWFCRHDLRFLHLTQP
jgi:hypothetical protein